MRILLTYIAVHSVFDVRVMSPYDGIGTKGEVLQEKPEAQESHAEIPILTGEAGGKHEEEHHCREDAGSRIKRVCWIDCAHIERGG